MKKNIIVRGLTVFVFFSALNLLSGCNWDPDAVAGKDPRFVTDAPEPLYPSCTETGPYEMSKSWVSRPPGPWEKCEYPVGAVENVQIDDKGITVGVSRLPDGNFPMIQQMLFSTSGASTLGFDCSKKGESADGAYQEISCVARTANRMSPVDLTSRDLKFLLKSMLLTNPACGAQALYEARDVQRSCTSGSNYHHPVQMDDAEFPPIWIEAPFVM